MRKIISFWIFIIALLLCGCNTKKNTVEIYKPTSVNTTHKNTSSTDIVSIKEDFTDNNAALSNESETTSNTSKILCVPILNQNPTLPTGCEATSATMVLKYYKEDITAVDFAKYCLPKSEDFYHKNGILYGPDPNIYFVGNPFSKNGYGCFSPVIVEAVNSNSRLCKAKRVYGNLEELCNKYINTDKPLIIWATMNMKPLKEGDKWLLQNEEAFCWPSGEHCLVLVGYDNLNYYFNDPLKGATVGYEKKTAEACFNALGAQAVLIEAYN